MPQHVRANDVALIGGDHVAIGALVEEDVEVVVPEVGQNFFELAVAVNGAQEFASIRS